MNTDADERRYGPALNSFATRSFRDIADGDYITARMAYRAHLMPQFHWSALQAIEKYLKCILLLNRVPYDRKDRLGHDIVKALARVEAHLTFPIRLSPPSRELIAHLNTFAQYRYLEVSYYSRRLEVVVLDRVVWELRRYCQWLKGTVPVEGGPKKPLLPMLLKRFEEAEARPHGFSLMFGQLEKIIKDRKHPARSALLWQNLYFGLRARQEVKLQPFTYSANAPLSQDPDLIEQVEKYVFVPNAVAERARSHAKGKQPKGAALP